MSNHLDPQTVEDLVRQLYRLGMVQREIARHANAELGSQGFVALAVVHLHGPLRVSEVARRLAVDLSVASRQVAALVGAGHLTREADPDDGRAHRVGVTDAGRRALEHSHRRMVESVARALEGWEDGEVHALASALQRLREGHESSKEVTA